MERVPASSNHCQAFSPAQAAQTPALSHQTMSPKSRGSRLLAQGTHREAMALFGARPRAGPASSTSHCSAHSAGLQS